MDALEHLAARLAGRLTPDAEPGPQPTQRRWGVVTATSVFLDSVTVELADSGTTIPGVRVVGVAVRIGDVVVVEFADSDPVVRGSVETGWHWIGQPGEPAFSSPWAAAGSTTPAFRKVGGVVYLTGQVAGGALATTIFTLPVGFRPGQYQRFATNSYNGAAEVHGLLSISSGVIMQIAGGTSGWVSLDPVRFIAEA